MVPMAVPPASALKVTLVSTVPALGEGVKTVDRVGAGAGSATVNMKLVVSPVPPISGEPETCMVYVSAVAVDAAVRVRVEVQVRLGVQEVGLNKAVTPVGRLPEAWLADRVIGEAAPLDLVTVIVLEPPVAPLTDVI